MFISSITKTIIQFIDPLNELKSICIFYDRKLPIFLGFEPWVRQNKEFLNCKYFLRKYSIFWENICQIPQ